MDCVSKRSGADSKISAKSNTSIFFSKWQLECSYFMWKFNGITHPIRTSCCMQTFNQWRQRPWVEILISVFLWQQPISTLKLNLRRQRRKKQQHFPLFRSFCDFCMLYMSLLLLLFSLLFVCKFQTQCARLRPIGVVCACVKIISKVICWRNVISRQCWQTWCTKVRHVYFERMNEWTHIKMRFAMAIFVWHASLLLSLLPLYYSTEFMSNWILNSLTFLSVPCNPEPSICMHTHIENGKWNEHTEEEKSTKWNKSKLRCSFW